MHKKFLKSVISKIWVLVRQSTQETLELNQLDEIRQALMDIKTNWSQNDAYFQKALHLCDSVQKSGILSVTQRNTPEAQEIIDQCQNLMRYLDS